MGRKATRPPSSPSSQSIAGKARAAKLSPERRREIAIKGAMASMKKAGLKFEDRRVRPGVLQAIEKKNEELSEELDRIGAVLLDPIAWNQRYLRNPETGRPFELYPEQEKFLREAFTPDPVTLKLKYDEVIFSAPKKNGKCVEKNELLTLADGRRIAAGELVGQSFSLPALRPNGRIEAVAAYAQFNSHEIVYRVTTRSGFSIVRNGAHPLWVAKRRRPEKESIEVLGWCPVEKLEVGDLVAVTDELPTFGTKSMNVPGLKILAYMIGDGTCTSGNIFSQAPGPHLDEFKICAESLGCELIFTGGFDYRIRGKDGGQSRNRRIVKHARTTGSYPINPILDLLREHKVAGCNSYQHRIPKAIFELKPELIIVFLSRLFAADGWACTPKPSTGGSRLSEIGYCSVSEGLVRDIAHLLLRFGIHGKITHRRARSQNGTEVIAWIFTIKQSEQVRRFANKIGIFGKEAAVSQALARANEISSYDWEHFKAIPGVRWERITDIQTLPESDTIAIEVPDGATYLTEYYEHNTTTSAMAILYIIGALGDERAEGYVASNSREQSADRVFADCAAIVRASPDLAAVANVRNDAIEFPDKMAFIKTVTTEASSAAGGRPTIVVFDELWGFQNRASHRLWDELVTTPTTRISLRFTVTYAGFTGESDLLESLYRQIFSEDNELQHGVTELAPDLYAKGRMLVYWTHEMRAPWITEEWIETQRRSYSTAQFARIMENRWVSSESTFIEGNSYDHCVDKTFRPPERAPHLHVWAAVDASVKKDSTAIVTVALDSEEVSEQKTILDEIRASKYPHHNPLVEMMAALPWKQDFDDSVHPPTLADLRVKVVDHKIIVPHGKMIDFSKIENYLIGLSRRYHVELIAFDPYQMVSLAQGLTRFGLPMYELTQTVAHAISFTELLRDLIQQMRLRVYPSDDLRSHVLNAASKESERGIRIIKRTKSARIDAAIALAMACFACARNLSVADEPTERAAAPDIYAV
jgi:LAGLIDADG-like domain/Terminase large subunit, endonuclease domain